MKQSAGFAVVNDTRLYYEIAGTGRSLVLIHGFSLDTRMWDAQFEALADHYQVIRYDLRGFGQSALPTQAGYSHVADLKALLADLQIEPVALLGLSKGGGVALDFALTYPTMVRALILIDTILGGFSWSSAESARNQLVWQEARRGGIAAAKASWLNHPLFAPALQQPTVAAQLTQIITAYSGWHFVNSNPEQKLEPPAVQRLSEVRVPTLLMVGEHDSPDFRHIADLIHHQVAHAQKVVLPHAGHMANMEAPALVNGQVMRWLDQAWS